MPTCIAFDLGGLVKVSPPLWPDRELQIQPGDLTQFTPNGNGVYGYQARKGKTPMQNAPAQEETAGSVLYFGNKVSRNDLDTLLRVLNVRGDAKDYAVFIEESKQPGKDGYIVQMRIVSRFALYFMFNALSESEEQAFPPQPLTIAEALQSFMDAERKRWGTFFGAEGLAGMFGGDGDCAMEELAFGFMVENEYHQVCRIWSRAWLVTK